MLNLIAIVGTNSDHSTNRQLLQYMQQRFSERAMIELVEIADFPLFNKPENHVLPKIVKSVATKIEMADGVIISTPEYDHSIPAALNNALAWLSYGIYPFVDKPVMITGASCGILGSSRAQQHLRQILDAPEIKARIMPSSEFLLGHSLQAFDHEGNLIHQQDIHKLDCLFEDFFVFVQLMAQLNHAYQVKKIEAENFNWEQP